MPTSPDSTLRDAAERQRAGDLSGAEALCRQAVAARPNDPRAWEALARALVARGRREEGLESLQRQVALAPKDAAAHANLGRVLRDLERAPEAEAAFDRALVLAPGLRPAVVGKAAARSKQGDHEAAFALLAPVLAAGDGDAHAVCAFSQAARSLKRAEAGVPHLERLLARADLPPAHRRMAGFELGHALDALGRYDDAFARYAEANARTATGNADPCLETMARVTAFFDADRPATLPRATLASDLPVFVVGMPRSGTSLVEQILAAHPHVHGGGELEIVPALAARLDREGGYPDGLAALDTAAVDGLARGLLDGLRAPAPEAKRVTDKMPHNFLHLGLLAMLVPGARVIHCVRDPVDTCLSCYFQDFNALHPYAADLAALGGHYRAYRDLMAHWEGLRPLPLMAVRYEALVADTEAVSREMVAFCGLEWDPRCLEFHASGRPVKTASRYQVQRPVYRSSVARWRRYQAHLEPLLDALGPLAEAQ